MADSLIKVLEDLQLKIKELARQSETLRHDAAALQAENDDLRRDLAEARAERDSARLDAEYLRYSHRLAASPDTIIETRRHIAKLIRNIDRCLEMLRE